MTDNKKKIDNHPSAGNPDPKTVSNATRVNEPLDPNDPRSVHNGATHPSSGNPDPKTVSNATRVNEPVPPATTTAAVVVNKKEKEVVKNDLPPSSDQPEEIERKAQEELQYTDKGKKKKAIEGGESDMSHATIGKNEEKEAREQNKKKSKKS
jgi:hypothetical protein